MPAGANPEKASEKKLRESCVCMLAGLFFPSAVAWLPLWWMSAVCLVLGTDP